MNYCPGQVFHYNLAAHEREVSGMKNIENFNPLACWRHYRDRKNRFGLLHDSSWVRPEDIGNYDGFFPLAKLATRMHSNPAAVIDVWPVNYVAACGFLKKNSQKQVIRKKSRVINCARLAVCSHGVISLQ